MRAEVEKLDIWRGGGEEGISPAVGHKENNFWFTHPVQFINHLNEAGLLDETFNPYEGHQITRRWNEPVGVDSRTVEVKDSPGFAPFWTASTPEWEGERFVWNNVAYAVPTALFNNVNSFNLETRRATFHIGVDFRGESGASIISFVHGRVINIGWVDPPAELRGNGRILVIANERGRGIYLLAHLHRDTETLRLRGSLIERGLRIEPHDVVALVGASGGNQEEDEFDPHLHVEYYDVQYDPALDRRTDNSFYVRVLGEGTPNRRLDLQGALTREGRTNGRINRRNPFDHEEEFLLPRRL